jgi:hypothetical protein
VQPRPDGSAAAPTIVNSAALGPAASAAAVSSTRRDRPLPAGPTTMRAPAAPGAALMCALSRACSALRSISGRPSRVVRSIVGRDGPIASIVCVVGERGVAHCGQKRKLGWQISPHELHARSTVTSARRMRVCSASTAARMSGADA